MRLHLRFLSGPRIGEQVTIEPPGGLVGREPASAIVIPDPSVSRQQAEVRWAGHGWQLRHLSSRSLTLLDDQPVGSRPLGLRRSGMLKLGAVLAQYWHDAEPAAAPPKTAEPSALPTLLNLPTLIATSAGAQMSQMSPIRAESAQEAPPTMIRRPDAVPPPAPSMNEEAASSTTVRMPRVDRPLQAAAPPTLVLRPNDKGPLAAQPVPKPAPAPPVTEHAPPVFRRSMDEDLAALTRQRDELRTERQRLEADLARLRQDNRELEAAKAVLENELELHRADAPTAPLIQASLEDSCRQGLTILEQFGNALEQASVALSSNDSERARGLVREASFSVADLRDLFVSLSSGKACP